MNEAAGDPALRRNRNFLYLWTGSTSSALGGAVMALVVPLLALTVTDSATAAGAVSAAGLMVMTVARLPAGVIIDRFPLRPLLVIPEILRCAAAAALAVLILVDRLDVVLLLMCSSLMGGASALVDTANSVAVRSVVPPSQLPQAFALNEGRAHGVSLIGQPLGGAMFGVVPALPMLMSAIASAAAALLCGAVRPAVRPLSARSTTLSRELFDGIRHVWRDPFLRTALTAAAVFQFAFAGVSFAVIADLSVRGFPAREIGIVFAIGAAGGIAGATAAGRLQRRLRPSTLILCMSWTTVFGFGLLGLVLTPTAAALIFGVIFFASTPANAMLVAVQMHRTPPELQGRVISAALLLAGLSAPLGPIAAGQLLDRTGPTLTFVSFATLIACVAAWLQVDRNIRTLTRPSDT